MLNLTVNTKTNPINNTMESNMINTFENVLSTLNEISIEEIQLGLDYYVLPAVVEAHPEITTTEQFMAQYLSIGEHLFPMLDIEEMTSMVDNCYTRELEFIGGPSDGNTILVKKSITLDELDRKLDMAVELGLEDFGTAQLNLGLDWVLIKNPCEGNWELGVEEGRGISYEATHRYGGTRLMLDGHRRIDVPTEATVLQVQELVNALVQYGFAEKVELIVEPEKFMAYMDMVVVYGSVYDAFDLNDPQSETWEKLYIECGTILTRKEVDHINEMWGVDLLGEGGFE